jgi:competence protein ComFC
LTNWRYRLAQAFWNGVDLLYPPQCGGCGRSNFRWCPDCQQRVRPLLGPLCDICGIPMDAWGICRSCQKHTPRFHILRSWVAFQEPVRQALHRLKYRRDLALGDSLAGQMASYVSELGWPVDMIIPVPLGKKRQKERGYNQVGLIARPLAYLMGWTYAPSALVRIRDTVSQVGLSADARRNNVWEAFEANSKLVAGKYVVITDDVATTGSTLSACADALLLSGAREVKALTVARALPGHGANVM